VALASSLKDQAVGAEVAVMGEVGLAGEVRTVPQCERRVAECARLGFTTLVIPRANANRIKPPAGVRLIGVDTVAQAMSVLF
jgi:DNA repair protein RadA/Sms